MILFLDSIGCIDMNEYEYPNPSSESICGE